MAEEKHFDNPGTDKCKKYDRQLRLWGDHGQFALESAKVCLINATATGTEILKNVILPGVGSFSIIDSNKVTGEDVGNNFFLEKDSIGKSRAQCACELLLELNEDVHGDFLEENVDSLVDQNPDFFDSFSIVITTNLPERSLLRLGHVLWEKDIPLLVCRSYGMIGCLRLVVKEHPVVESHPDNTIEDLRLDCPFPALVSFCDSLNMEQMSKKDHSHTPWLVVMYKALQKWKEQHNGAIPKDYKEKVAFKETIREGMWKNANGDPEEEENFEEAIQHVNTALIHSKIHGHIQHLFDDPKCNNLNSDSKTFWILTRAVKEFVLNEGNGCSPLRGTIPDMTADSERYIQLQNAYREQAAQDIACISNTTHNILQSLGRDEPLVLETRHTPANSRLPDFITDADIRTFCRNVSFLRLIRTRSLAEEYDNSRARVAEIAAHLEDTDEDDIVFYVLLRAIDRFYSEYNHYPGYDEDQMEAEIPQLKNCLTRLLQDWGLTPNIKDDFVHEMCRYGASELHTVASFMGGVAAQEVIKIVTGQFVPINNTFVYNAMRQTSVTAEL